jgi:hypothetical protein
MGSTLLVPIRQRLWRYNSPYKHKIVFDVGSCWKAFKQYAQCGLGFLPATQHGSGTATCAKTFVVDALQM